MVTIATTTMPQQPLSTAKQGPLVQRYVLPPQEIETLSLERVRLLTPQLEGLPEGERLLIRRMVYACGDPSICPQVRIHPDAVAAGVEALRSAARIVTDVRMVEVGLDRQRMERLGSSAHCLIDDPTVAERARESELPRAVVAMRTLAPALADAIVVVGNAPTGLLALLDLIDEGIATPALIIGIPVGFVVAAESKDELTTRSCPFVTVLGHRGGSALAVAAANALLRLSAD